MLYYDARVNECHVNWFQWPSELRGNREYVDVTFTHEQQNNRNDRFSVDAFPVHCLSFNEWCERFNANKQKEEEKNIHEHWPAYNRHSLNRNHIFVYFSDDYFLRFSVDYFKQRLFLPLVVSRGLKKCASRWIHTQNEQRRRVWITFRGLELLIFVICFFLLGFDCDVWVSALSERQK